MKSRRHRNESTPFSLFSFQDIITGISGIMIFVLLILSLELTMPVEEKDAEEESRKTLFAQDPMEIFKAGKLELANSHSAMTKAELMDIYLEDGTAYFKIDEKDLPPTGIGDGAGTNQPNELKPNQINNTQNAEDVQKNNTNKPGENVAGVGPVTDPASTGDPSTAEEEEQEDPLKNAFIWLGENQNANGSWDTSHQHGITGLVVMSYLAYRERTGNTEFDDALQNGIDFLVQDENCKPGSDKFAYQNGIKALALTEAVRVLGSKAQLEKAIKDSITYIVVGQQDGGGFHYMYNTKTKSQDLSVAAWNLQALHAAAKLYNIDLARDGVEKAKPWLTAMSKKYFTYNTRNHEASDNPKESHKESMRAIGTWLTLALNKENYENVKDELEQIATETYAGLSWNPKLKHPLYCWNYATMAMMVAGGENRDKWKKKLSKLLLDNQTAKGYWSKLKFGHGSKPFYSTAFCAHMLALVYDYKNAASNGPPKGIELADSAGQPKPDAGGNSQPGSTSDATPDNNTDNTAEPTDPVNPEIEKKDPGLAKGSDEVTEDGPAEEFDNLISLDKNKAHEIKKRLNIFRRSIKSDPDVRKALEEKDLEALNDAIVKFLDRKFFLEAQLNKMNKDPYIHDEALLKDQYIHLNKQVTELMKKIHQYKTSNSSELTLSPIKIYVSSKELDIELSDGQNLRFSTSADGLKDFQAWLQGKDPLKDVLMINIKPSGVSVYRKIDSFIDILNFKNLTSPVDENAGAK